MTLTRSRSIYAYLIHDADMCHLLSTCFHRKNSIIWQPGSLFERGVDLFPEELLLVMEENRVCLSEPARCDRVVFILVYGHLNTLSLPSPGGDRSVYVVWRSQAAIFRPCKTSIKYS